MISARNENPVRELLQLRRDSSSGISEEESNQHWQEILV